MTLPIKTAQILRPPVGSNTLRSLLSNRRFLLALGALVLILGLAFKWNWLVAAGIAPLLLAALPCLAMCALGLCMHKMSSGSANADASSASSITGSAPLQLATDSNGLPEPQAASEAAIGPSRVAGKSCCKH
ncbi:hypothetical protein [Agrobacterium sp. P15N1-A]|uniref:hypothetical protein n=1 Tax=Agrobacterium sp. P15N1-A TaxID=3342820 RepID=UPI0037CD97E6